MTPTIDQLKFQLDDIVSHAACDPDELGIVTGILWRSYGYVYLVTWGDTKEEKYHHPGELRAGSSFKAST